MCTECELGTFASSEGAAECTPCYKPTCAKAVTSCNALTGFQATYTYYDPFEALSILCGEPSNASDACAAPSHCIAGAAQCGAEPQRWALRTLAVGAPNTSTLRPAGVHPDWGVLSACPHLRGNSSFANPACWDQLAGPRDTSTLLFSANSEAHTAVVPTTFTTTCGAVPVAARYQ